MFADQQRPFACLQRWRKHQVLWLPLWILLWNSSFCSSESSTLALLPPHISNQRRSTRRTFHAVTPSLKKVDGFICRRQNYFQAQSTGYQRCRMQLTAVVDDKSSDRQRAEKLENDKIKDPDFLRRNKQWIVLVDDEEAIRMAVGDYLYDQGFQVTACADVGALFEACRIGPPDAMQSTTNHTAHNHGEVKPTTMTLPDAVISDIRMPGKDGMELLTLLRTSDSRWERVPVILLTAKAMTQDRIAGYKAGADYFLPKPFNPEELLSMIDNAILRRQQMAGTNGKLVDLKVDLANVKEMLRQKGSNVVKKTNVYLSPAEREVLDLLCQGNTNSEIAAKRGVSVIGVNRMIQKMYSLTQTRTRTELVRWAITTGYVSAR